MSSADSLDLERAVALLNGLAEDQEGHAAAWARQPPLQAKFAADAALLRLLAERLPELLEADTILRRGWWLSHGHGGLYGDDGEMQCSVCLIDFKRMPAREIEARLFALENPHDYAQWLKGRPLPDWMHGPDPWHSPEFESLVRKSGDSAYDKRTLIVVQMILQARSSP